MNIITDVHMWQYDFYTLDNTVISYNHLSTSTLPNHLSITAGYVYGLWIDKKTNISNTKNFDLITYDNEKKIARYAEVK